MRWLIRAALYIVLCPAPLSATDYWFTSQVKSIQVFSNGTGFILTLAADSPNCAGTTSPKRYYISDSNNGITVAGVPALLAAAMTGQSTGHAVSLYFSDLTPNCYVNNIRLEN